MKIFFFFFNLQKKIMEKSTEKVVEDLLNGENVSKFSRDSLLDAKKILTERKQKAINDGDIDSVRKIQIITEDIDNFNESADQQKSNKKEVSQLPSLPKIKSNPNLKDKDENDDSHLKEILDNIINGSLTYSAVETDDIENLIQICKNTIKNLISQRKLLVAQQYQDCCDDLMALKDQRKKENKVNTKETNLENQIQSLDKTIKEMRKEMIQKLKEHDNETQEWVQSTESENNEKYQKYDQETQDNIPKEVAKPSPELLNLKQQAEFLISLRHFAQAAQLDKEAEEREKQELDVAIHNYHHSRRIKKEKMINDDNEKIRIYLQKRATNRNQLQRDLTQEIERLEKTQNNLKSKHSNQPKPRIPPVSTSKSTSRNTPFMTQRLLLPLGRRPVSAFTTKRPTTSSSGKRKSYA